MAVFGQWVGNTTTVIVSPSPHNRFSGSSSSMVTLIPEIFSVGPAVETSIPVPLIPTRCMPTWAYMALNWDQADRSVFFPRRCRQLQEQAICFRFGWTVPMEEIPMNFAFHG